MRIHPVDTLLFTLMKFFKFLDRRLTDLTHLDPSNIHTILVVSSTAIGDTLLSTPAIRAVRERYPQGKIIAHLNMKNMELFENNPHIDEIIPYRGGYRKFFSTVAALRKRKFDLVLVFHGNEPQATPMAYLSGARFIVKIPCSRQYAFLLSNKKSDQGDLRGAHAIDVRLKAASLVNCGGTDRRLVLNVDKVDETFIDSYMRSHNIRRDDTVIGLQLGAASRYKIWPLQNFIELGRKLLSWDPGLRVILTGSKQEQDICRQAARRIEGGALSVAGEISLRQLRSLIKRMDVLVTNDTGMMHMAIALQTPTASLFCPTDHLGVGAVQDPGLHKIIHAKRPCDPCTTKKCMVPVCMELITVDEVYHSVRELLNRRRNAAFYISVSDS